MRAEKPLPRRVSNRHLSFESPFSFKGKRGEVQNGEGLPIQSSFPVVSTHDSPLPAYTSLHSQLSKPYISKPRYIGWHAVDILGISCGSASPDQHALVLGSSSGAPGL